LEQDDMRILYKFLGNSLSHDSLTEEEKQPIRVNVTNLLYDEI
jgi:hypothetical protein